MVFGEDHVRQYRETGGRVGHEWRPGVFTLLLTTQGRRSGRAYTTPLIYGRDGREFVVVASKGGAAAHPDWYRNLEANPEVKIQVEGDVLRGTARTVTGDERRRLWDVMTEIWPAYNDYARKTHREIPVVVISPQQ